MSKMARWLKEVVDWDKFFSIVETTGDSLNERKNRFDKSDIFEQALEVCSDGRVKWVDEVGHDHIYNMAKLEMKSQQNCLYTKKNGDLKGTVKDIKLMNSLGDASGRSFDDVVRFDYLLIVDTDSPVSYSAAMIHRDDIDPSLLDLKKDGVTLKSFSTEKLDFIVRPNELSLEINKNIDPYGFAKREAQRKYLEQF
tara:strand:+ start:544 stop:1131 length:588 start_codon:yes stop_codon:yes gene_type:complete